MVAIPDAILSRFAPWGDFKSWVICNAEKQIVQKRNGYLCRWREDPQDNIMTLSECADWCTHVDWGGFGVILGEDNLLGCLDFDDCLDKSGLMKNPEVDNFLTVARSFTELSTSGKGIHIFFALSKPHVEFALRDDFCKGKFYVDRFIKLTGEQYQNHDYPIRVLTEREILHMQKQIGVDEPQLNKPAQPKLPGSFADKSWSSIFQQENIIHFPSQYTGRYRRGKVVTESWKVVCPNKDKHTTDRPNDPSAHLAILCKYDDGSSSLSCNHNSCAPEGKPNLLQKLWDRIKGDRPVKCYHCGEIFKNPKRACCIYCGRPRRVFK